jgi:O-antigen/teichoic acid export membrane protein
MSKTRGSIGLVAAKLVQLVLQVVAVRLYLKWLGQDSYGIVLLFAALAPYLLLLDIGFTVAAQRLMTQRLSEGDPEGARRVHRCLIYLNAWITLASAITFVFLFLFLPLKAPGITMGERVWIFVAAGVQFLATWLNFTLVAALMAYERFRRLAALNAIASIVTVLLGIAAAYVWRSPQALLGANAFSAMAILAINAHALKPVFGYVPIWGTYDPDITKELRTVGLRSYVHRAIGGLASSTDKVLLGSVIGTRELSQYAVPTRLPETLYDTLSPVYTTTLPELTRARSAQDPKLPTILEHNSLLVLGLACGALLVPCGFGSPLLLVLFGETFPQGDVVCVLMALCKSVELFYAALAMLFYAEGRPDRLVPLTLANAAGMAVLTIPAYHWFGFGGIAALKAVITMAQFGPIMALVRRNLGAADAVRSLSLRALLILLVAICFAIGAMYLSRTAWMTNAPWLSLVLAPVAASIYVALVVGTRICPLPSGAKRRLKAWLNRDAELSSSQ